MSIQNREIAVAHEEVKERARSNGQGKRVLIPAEDVRALQQHWRTDPRWRGITRNYTAEKVLGLRGTLKIEYTIADRMSRKLWRLMNTIPYVNALGALTVHL